MAVCKPFIDLVILSTVFLVSLPCIACHNHTRVIIVGAGLSGLGCATTLLEKGMHDFLVLEAKDYVGGRVKSVPFDGKNISAGAGWIQDIGDHNSVWRFKLAHGVKTTRDDYGNLTVRNKGGPVSSAKSIFSRFEGIIEKAASKNKEYDHLVYSDVSLQTILKIVGWRAQSEPESAVEYHLTDFEHGLPPDRLSARQAIITEEITDEVVVDPRGISYIPTTMAQGIMDKIILNSIVTNITYSSSGTGVNVITKDGTRYTADYILVTVSNGVLGSDLITFRPPLPEWKTEALAFLPMAQYTKIFVKFQRKFWDDTYYTLLASSKRGYYTHMQNMDREGLFKDDNIVVVTVTNPQSELVEKLTMAELKKELTTHFAAQYPSAGITETSITEIFRSTWSLDPYVRGSYSAPGVGTDDITFANLRAPVGSLWFAGEATTDKERYGYMQGALDSGREQATSLLACMKDNRCSKYQRRPSRACKFSDGNKGTKASLLFICSLALVVLADSIF